jgi:hypothetical protein
MLIPTFISIFKDLKKGKKIIIANLIIIIIYFTHFIAESEGFVNVYDDLFEAKYSPIYYILFNIVFF